MEKAEFAVELKALALRASQSQNEEVVQSAVVLYALAYALKKSPRLTVKLEEMARRAQMEDCCIGK